jgi:hypothetical protein
MRKHMLYGFAAALLLLPAGACSEPTGALSMAVRFADFQVQAIPAGTREIRVGVAGDHNFKTQLVLSPTVSTRLVGGVPVGSALVGAVAYGANGEPLGGGRATTLIRSQERSQAIIVLVAGAVDEALMDLAGRPTAASPSPSPSESSATPSPGATPSPPPESGATPPPPGPTPTPVAAPTATATPFVAPTANVLPGGAGGGGGALATPTPTPTPPTGAGVTVLPGNPYTGPVTVSP